MQLVLINSLAWTPSVWVLSDANTFKLFRYSVFFDNSILSFSPGKYASFYWSLRVLSACHYLLLLHLGVQIFHYLRFSNLMFLLPVTYIFWTSRSLIKNHRLQLSNITSLNVSLPYITNFIFREAIHILMALVWCFYHLKRSSTLQDCLKPTPFLHRYSCHLLHLTFFNQKISIHGGWMTTIAGFTV